MARFTSARIGGPADFLLVVHSADDLAKAASQLWEMGQPFRVLGGGSNVLVADAGLRGVVVLNQAREVKFEVVEDVPRVWCESGAAFGSVARRCVERGWTGLEWACTIPGTVGGAVVGNAGAHGGDVENSLQVADILQQNGRVERWQPERFEFGYRDSRLKRHPGGGVVLSALFLLEMSTTEDTKARMAEFLEYRKSTQPSGASWGSMFRNPPGDHAGRLIEAAGLKGMQAGDVMISPMHANFIVNRGGATAEQAWSLIRTARETVLERFGIELELEIELLGDWGGAQQTPSSEVGD